MKFKSDSMLTLNTPKAAYDPSINDEISVFIKRAKDSSPNATLFFIGNGNDPDNNDYLAMDMVNGKLRFHYKLSSGEPQSVTVNRYIEIGVQYTLRVKRYVLIKALCVRQSQPSLESPCISHKECTFSKFFQISKTELC